MSVTLGDEDRRAVDLLLDRDGSKSNGGDANAVAADGRIQQRVQRVEQILSLLSHMTTGEPPPDLVKKALQRIEEVKARAHPGQPMDRAIDENRPTA